jgi:hypothetical protein
MTSHDPHTTPELGLFAEPRRVAVPHQRARRSTDRRPHTGPGGGDEAVINDMDLIEAVLVTARERGYLLVGESEQVSRRCGEDAIDPTTDEEATAVRQLLGVGLLTVGGWHAVTRLGREARGRSVLVPGSTRALSRRLGAYHRPASWGTATHTSDARERS